MTLRPRRSGWRGRLGRTWARHPRLGLAVKAALAASLAWTLVQVLPGPAADYPYYAPLGAVFATSTTLAGSAREAFQAVTAIVLGAALALGVDLLFGPNLVTVAVVVGGGVLLAGWDRLGSSRSWLPTSALFVLIIGNRDPLGYVLGYAGLTLLGALVGLAVMAAFPPLPLAPAQVALRRLRDTLAGQLDDLADGLRQEHPPTEDEWRRRIHAIDPVLAQSRETVAQATEARRGNLRARRYRDEEEQQYRQARALERLTLLIEELTQVIASTKRAEFTRVALGPELRPPAARALAALATALRSLTGATPESEAFREADAVAAELADAVRRARGSTETDLFAAGSIVDSVTRALDAFRPRDLAAAGHTGP